MPDGIEIRRLEPVSLRVVVVARWCGVGLLRASRREVIGPFTGLSPVGFARLVASVRLRGRAAVADGRKCRPWSLPLADRVLVVAVYYRTNLTMRQVAILFGITPAAVHRIIARLAPFLALAPLRRPGPGEVTIVDGTLVPCRDRAITAPSKNYRSSVNMQVLISADTRLVLAVGQPLPGNRNDCIAFADSGIDKAAGHSTVIADGGYQSTGCIIPHRRRAGQEQLIAWKERHNAAHRKIRARVEHVFASMKHWKILRDCRRRGTGVHYATLAVARMHNLNLTR